MIDNDWVVVIVYSQNHKTRPFLLEVEGPYTMTGARDAAKYYRDTAEFEPEKLPKNFLYAQARKMFGEQHDV